MAQLEQANSKLAHEIQVGRLEDLKSNQQAPQKMKQKCPLSRAIQFVAVRQSWDQAWNQRSSIKRKSKSDKKGKKKEA